MEENNELHQAGHKRILTRREFLILAFSIVITYIIALVAGTIVIRRTGEIGYFANSLAVLAQMMIIALPTFLLAGIMFASDNSRAYMLHLKTRGMSHRRVFLFRFIQTILVMAVYSAIAVFAAFAHRYVFYPARIRFLNWGDFLYMPATLIATIVISFFTLSIATILATLTDSNYMPTLIGIPANMVLAYIGGWITPLDQNYLTPRFTFVSIGNMVKGLAILGNDISFSSESIGPLYFGFKFVLGTFLFSFLGYLLLSVFCLAISLLALSRNMVRWEILTNIDGHDIPKSTSRTEGSKQRKIAEKKIQTQRMVAVFIVSLLLTSATVGYSVYSRSIFEQTTLTHYESPQLREAVELGDWRVIEFDVNEPPENLSIIISYSILMEDWGSSPDNLTYTHAMLRMTKNEFNSLSHSAKSNLCLEPRNATRGEWIGTGRHRVIEERFGVHIVVFHAYATSNSSISGVLHLLFRISQRGSQ